jgi:hypothetical protein
VASGVGILSAGGCSKTSEDKLAGNVTCDTTSVSYANGVVPILQNNCYECHGQGRTGGSGGVLLEGYTNLKVYADNGYLAGNISHAAGFNAMPYGRPKLPDCEVNTVVAWVHQGAKNN